MFKNKKLTIALFVVFLVLLGGTFVKRYLIAPEIKLEEVEIQNFLGEKFALSNLKGKVVVLNFWATWCPPCVQEMPMFDNLFKAYEGKNVEFILATDEPNSKVVPFVKKHALTVPVYQLTKDMKEHGVYTIPATFIFDKKGKLIGKKMGVFESADELQKMIDPHL